REEADDVAVQERRLAAARRWIRAVLQVLLVDDDELRVMRVARLRRPEEPEQRAVGVQHARQLAGDLHSRRLVQIVDDVPRENAVDRSGLLRKAVLQERG